MPVKVGTISPIAPSSSLTPIQRTSAAGTSCNDRIVFFTVVSGRKAFIPPTSRNTRARRPWTAQSAMFICLFPLSWPGTVCMLARKSCSTALTSAYGVGCNCSPIVRLALTHNGQVAVHMRNRCRVMHSICYGPSNRKSCHLPEREGNALQRVKYALTEQREARPAISLLFDEFQFVDLTVGMHHGESCQGSLFVSFKPRGLPLHFGQSALGNLLLPVFQAMPFSLAHDLPKGLHQGVQGRQSRTGLAQFLEIGAFVCFQIIKGTSDQPEGILDRDAIQNGGRGKHDGLLPKRSDEPIHGPYLSRKALGLDFLPQEGNIATPLLPPREHVGGIGIEDTAPLTLTL